MIIKAIVLFLLLVIIISLASGLVFLLKDNGNSDRVVKALTVRISLSLVAFLLLMSGYYFGLIKMNDPFPKVPAKTEPITSSIGSTSILF